MKELLEGHDAAVGSPVRGADHHPTRGGTPDAATTRQFPGNDSPQREVLMLLFALVLLAAPVDSGAVRDIEVAPGETLRITTLGAGQPVVLIPGIFGSAFSYRAITRPLAARGYQTIVIEPLGYGWSSHPKHADYSFAAQTERVSRALDQLGVTRALFVAQSTGAAIAFRLAIARPGLV